MSASSVATATDAVEREPPSPRPVGIGLIGAGWMGRLHTEAYMRVPFHYPDCLGRARLVVCSDVDQAALDQARGLGWADVVGDPLAVINHPEVEAVSIATPNRLHRELALAAIAAGKPFWGEKPLGRSPEDTRAIAAALRTASIPTIVGLNYRHVPLVVHARRLIEQGFIGEIRSYRGYFLVDYAADPARSLSWRFLRDEAGLGVLGDLMSHSVDNAHFLVGPLAEVNAGIRTDVPERPRPLNGAGSQFAHAAGELAAVENDDSAWATVSFANGATGYLEVSRTSVSRHNTFGFEVYGTEGALAWEFQRMNELTVYEPSSAGRDVGVKTVWAGPQHGDFGRFEPGAGIPMGYSDLKVTEAKLFLDSVVDRASRAPGVPDMLAAADAIDAMLRSAEAGGWVTVDYSDV